MTVERVGVVGCGLMGSGIAEVCARAGTDVVVREADEALLRAGAARIEQSLGRAVRAGKVSEDERERALGRLHFSTDWEAMADRQLDRRVAASDSVLASNTSSIPIMKLAMVTGRPEQVIGIHFFNPVPVLRLVELVTSLLTSDDTAEHAEAFVTSRLSKLVIRSQDRAGFVVNAMLIPYLLSAVRMFESGFASREDIDTGMVEGCAHPMGPLALADLIGLDTTQAVAQSLYEEFKEPLYAPPPLLSRMVEANLLGRKTGRGFYDYSR